MHGENTLLDQFKPYLKYLVLAMLTPYREQVQSLFDKRLDNSSMLDSEKAWLAFRLKDTFIDLLKFFFPKAKLEQLDILKVVRFVEQIIEMGMRAGVKLSDKELLNWKIDSAKLDRIIKWAILHNLQYRSMGKEIVEVIEDCKARIVSYDHNPNLWQIKRDPNFSRVPAIPKKPNASLQGLACKLKLDTNDATGPRGWLRTADGKSVSKFEGNKSYLVPNIVFADLGQEGKLCEKISLSIFYIQKKVVIREASALRSKGFKVLISENVSANFMKGHLRTDGIYIYLYAGHAAGVGHLSPVYNQTVEPGRYCPYKIRNMVLLGCSTLQNKGKATNLNDLSKTYWNLNVSTKGWVAGYRDDVSSFDFFFNLPQRISGTTESRTPDVYDYR